MDKQNLQDEKYADVFKDIVSHLKRTEVEKFTFIPLLSDNEMYCEYGFDFDVLMHILDKWDILPEKGTKDTLQKNIATLKITISYYKFDKLEYEETIEFHKKHNSPIRVEEIFSFLQHNVFDVEKLERHFGFPTPKIVLG